MSRCDKKRDQEMAELKEDQAKLELKVAFTAYIQRATDNCQDMSIAVNEAWASFASIMSIQKSKTSEQDVLGALEFAMGFIPVIGTMMANTAKLGSMALSSHDAVTSTPGFKMGAAGNIPQLRAAHEKISKTAAAYTGLSRKFDEIYKQSSLDELKQFIKRHIGKPVTRMVDKDRSQFRYMTEYQLFKSYVAKNVVVGREPEFIVGKGLVELGPWKVQSGLNKAQETHIYATFGGGLPQDAAPYIRNTVRLYLGQLTGNQKMVVQAGWKLLTSRVSAVATPKSLSTAWRATWKDRAPNDSERNQLKSQQFARKVDRAVGNFLAPGLR